MVRAITTGQGGAPLVYPVTGGSHSSSAPCFQDPFVCWSRNIFQIILHYSGLANQLCMSLSWFPKLLLCLILGTLST